MVGMRVVIMPVLIVIMAAVIMAAVIMVGVGVILLRAMVSGDEGAAIAEGEPGHAGGIGQGDDDGAFAQGFQRFRQKRLHILADPEDHLCLFKRRGVGGT